MILGLDNRTNFLRKLGFNETESNIFIKRYPKHSNYEIKIELNPGDFKKSKIYYNPDRETTEQTTPKPNGQILLGDLTTSNFKNPENFVVLEAVNRLLDLGYKPENIHLERKWRLGHTGKSGKADIIVYEDGSDKSGERKTFTIIECKTWGEEFEKEKIRLFKNGGQLFSYYQQEGSTRVLVLYTSTYEGGEITFDDVIIRVDDSGKQEKALIEKCKKQRKNKDYPCSFSEALDIHELVDVWKRVYNQFVFKHGIFEPDAGLYSLDLKSLKKKDLVPLKSSQGLFNAFAEILRHNNISDNANAFNKMMSLFLCKIVDEESKKDEDVLDFQVKFGESFENLMDRLQALYKKGMDRYLEVKNFVYYSDEDIRKIINLYPTRSTLEEIEGIFREIKYYTNNEFAFKEVHNKELFRQNALILSEIIELLQKYQLKYSHKNQILGDFFELLLNHGVKQSEGQFFTPLPIVRFMIIGVALDEYIKDKTLQCKETEDEPLPKVLDYACGVAHFLTEAIDEINKVIKSENIKVRLPWEERYIYGIEKDYRLARTAKIACFLNGDGSTNIIFGDGLDDYKKLHLDEKKFDFVLTNPPYSIRKFKNYLDVKPQYELLQYLTENSSEIEVLFIERAKQVLDEGGRAAIILPSSILSNTGVYTKAREILLKYFEIKAIAEFGSQTFIATGTNTVVLFLERRGDGFVEDRERIANEIYEEKTIKHNDYIDIERLFKSFVNYRGLPYKDYRDFVFKNIISDNLSKTEVFQSYRDWFEGLTEIKNLKKNKAFKSKPEEEQQEILDNFFKDRIRAIEKEKFLYFSLMLKCGERYGDENWYELQKVVVARAPHETTEQKQYLGYEFNKRRGFEGIEIYKDENGKPTTKLYDDENYENPKKIASYIRANFKEELTENQEIDESVSKYLNIYNLPDLFDFEMDNFEKKMNLSPQKKIVIDTKWELKKLGDVCPDSIHGLIFPKEARSQSKTSKKVLTSSHIALDGKLTLDNPIYLSEEFKIDPKYRLRKGDIFISTSSGSLKHLGKSVFIQKDLDYFAGGFCAILRGSNYTTQKYISLILNQDFFKEFVEKFNGQNINNLKIGELKKFKIPVPPLDIQKKIVSEIETLEKEETKNEERTNNLESEIKNEMTKCISYSPKQLKLKDIFDIEIGGTPRRNEPRYWRNGKNPWVSVAELNGNVIYDTREKITDEGVKSSNVKLIPKNTTLVSFKLSLGKVGFTGIDLYTNEAIAALIPKGEQDIDSRFTFYLFKYLKPLENLRVSGKKFGKSLNSKILREIRIPVPPLKTQQQVVSEIEKLEKGISQLKQRNEEIEDEKKRILEKYLHGDVARQFANK